MENVDSNELQKLYIAFFGRPGDPSGINYWLSRSNESLTIKEISNQLSIQDEYLQYIVYDKSFDFKINKIYLNLFNRKADFDGLNYWIGKYTSGENDDRAVSQSFIVSDEFKERFGSNISNAKYVETLYVNVLGRDYDQDGYNYWLGNLNAGTETRYELLLGFAESAENKTLFTDMTGFG